MLSQIFSFKLFRSKIIKKKEEEILCQFELSPLTISTSALRQDLMWFLTKLTQSFSVSALSCVPMTYMSCGITPSTWGSLNLPVPLHRNQLLIDDIG